MRTIEIPKDQWFQLMKELGREDWDFIYLELSSNSGGVWLKEKPSFHWEWERKPGTLNQYSFIKEIHKEVLKHNSRGKQFCISDDKVRLSDGGVLICHVKFV